VSDGAGSARIVELFVPALLDGVRLDRAVSMLTGRSRAAAADLVAAGAVRVDGVPRRGRALPLVAGATLRIELGDEAVPTVLAEPEVPLEVVYVDDDLVVVDKPAGLVVHPGAGQRHGTLVGGLLARFPDLAALAERGVSDPERPGIVHRLDKDTSGLLVVARTPRAVAGLGAQLADRTMGRGYAALVTGRVVAERGLIDAPVGRSERRATAMAVSARGRPARTRYRVVRRFEDARQRSYTLLALALETGRTHQIRVHLAAIGHPLVGDPRYGGPTGKPPAGGPRPWLHAYRLGLVHPGTGEPMAWRSDVPEELVAALRALGGELAPLPEEV
jgi:23S rRNA pseudouridine1911/1915/1917 synthase